MYRIPQRILEKLKCSICDGYLSTKPLMVKGENNHQVCGKCYKLLPAEEKEKYVRQIGLESLAEVFIFPCIYKQFGCDYTYNWCEEKDHEINCTYRYDSLPNNRTSIMSEHVYCTIDNTKNNTIEGDDLTAQINYQTNFNLLTYTVNIKPNNNKSLILKTKDSQTDLNDIDISLNGSLSLQSLEITQNSITVNSKQLNVTLRCLNCKIVVENESKYSCLFGHVSCKNCKGNMCIMCAKIMEKESKRFCKNYKNGCKVTLSTEDLNVHQDNCDFNDYKCPLEPCNYIDRIQNVVSHIMTDHKDKVYLNNEITRTFFNKDDTFVVVWNHKVFKCVYYYYKTFVEFFVEFLGSSQEASKYFYEVSIILDGTILRKKSNCAHWNNMMLEKGVNFDRKDLVMGNDKKLKFDMNLKIMLQPDLTRDLIRLN